MTEAPANGTVVAPPPQKVAVIAVHGVAYHAPGASANAMADLLLSLPNPLRSPVGAPRNYSAFEAEAIQVPIQPVRVWTYGLRSEEHTSELQSLTNLVCR